MPERIRRQRTAGWRMPEGVVYVGRPTRWGNPFVFRSRTTGLARVPGALTGQPWEFEGRISGPGIRHDYFHPGGKVTACEVRYMTRGEVTDLFRRALARDVDAAVRAAWCRNPLDVTPQEVQAELRGRDLACWCPIGQPCHADVLLEVANGPLLPPRIVDVHLPEEAPAST